jgi:hypothetical protein
MVTLIGLGAVVTVAVSATLEPLQVKTGLWQMTETVTWTGLPPELQAAMASGRSHNYQSCVKTEDLRSNPWAEGSSARCKWTVLNSTGTDMEVQGTACDLGNGMSADVHGKIHVIDAQNGNGSFDITMMQNGQTMMGHASYSGKWIGSTCPAE